MWKISSLPDELTAGRPRDAASVATSLIYRLKDIEPVVLLWWCFALATLSASLARYYPTDTGFTYVALVITGAGPCAWLWFLSRALFRDRKHLGVGVFSLVPLVIAIEAAAALTPFSGASVFATEAGRIIRNAEALVCFTAIAFVWRETLHGFSGQPNAAERRVRVLFLAGFSLLVGVSLLWVSGAAPGSIAAEWQDTMLTLCALLTLIISLLAVQFRLRHPLHETAGPGRNQRASSVEGESVELASRILTALKDDKLLTSSYLKVADLAEHTGDQEYKVTRCITSHLGYRNFNHLVNSFRIERAKRLFEDPERQRMTIASIAYDCGFNSLGPFNRAFRQHTGVTPKEYRQRSGAA
ncbi:helix-turn-helix transcriptional regulator [Pseudohongiella sp. SYSU M77423]|uniref:helix-turn-helix domain-containing protein n=1 Tax=unclassified Pseudohongiella TaxID=2629611 RepID=UPI001F19FBF9|nr:MULTISPECIES: helix-turn-helix transcriptional regulator [unclassified Pseudohongiella]MDH7943411.1 helix-turn-helix transcriptional regulator [Pseudohongiella sp. SYSU M77423]